MNYLAHYYIDHSDNRPHFTLGLVLPDLVRNFKRQYRIKPLHISDMEVNSLLLHLNQGVQRHFFADKVFHSSVFFDRHYSLLKKRIQTSDFNGINKYSYFVAHVFLEMLIDRILISQNPFLGSNFYKAIENTDEELISIYIQKTCDLGVEQVQQFLTHLDMFCKSQYLLQYRHNDGFIFGLQRMYQRYVPTFFTESDKEKLVNLIEEFEFIVSNDLEDLFSKNGIFYP